MMGATFLAADYLCFADLDLPQGHYRTWITFLGKTFYA